jgi:serine protease Do
MKNRFSWIVRGIIAGSVVGYATFCDPLQDALVAIQALDQHESFVSDRTDQADAADKNSLAEPVWKSKLVQQGGKFGRELQIENSRVHQRNHLTTLRAFRESIGDQWKSTCQVLSKDRQIALGTIVAADGWIASKSSEISNDTVDIRLFDNSKAVGTVKLRRNDLDLVLIKVQRTNLPTIVWSTDTVVRVGGWLATLDIRNQPIAIGVLGVTSRNVRRERAVLGVELGKSPSGQNGALIRSVTLGSGADRAGMQPGDVINTIDGKSLRSEPEVREKLEGLIAGQRVDVGVLREGKKVMVTAQMMDLNSAFLLDPTEMEVNGDISSRSTGFQSVMQHDSVLAPYQCGGPVIDVYGNVVGLNIARAGRVSSYAIPASIASAAIAEMIASASVPTAVQEDSVVQASTKSPSIRTSIELPTSIPSGIAVESLKPEVIVPNAITRP